MAESSSSTSRPSFEQGVDELRAFVLARGRYPRADGGGREPSLARWIGKACGWRRGRGSARHLTPARAAALEALPGWSWEGPPAPGPGSAGNFELRLVELRRYVGARGALPGSSSPLSRWVSKVRGWKRREDAGEARAPYLTPARTAALEAVPGWTWAAPRRRASVRCATFEERLAEYRAFVGAAGRHPRGGRGVSPAERRLAEWAGKVRSWRRGLGKAHRLTAARAAALEAVPGWSWGAERCRPNIQSPQFDDRLDELRAFVAEHGRLPRKTEALASCPGRAGAETSLAKWASKVRSWYRGVGRPDRLTPGRVAALEAVPGWTWEAGLAGPAAGGRFAARAAELRAFVAEHGRFPRKHRSHRAAPSQAERSLACWVTYSRRRLAGSLGLRPYAPEQAAALAAIPGWEGSARAAAQEAPVAAAAPARVRVRKRKRRRRRADEDENREGPPPKRPKVLRPVSVRLGAAAQLS